MTFAEFMQKIIPARTYAIKPPMPTVEPPKPILIKNRGLSIMPNELKLLSSAIFSEIGNRGDTKRDLEARVVANTILNRMKETGKNLTQILTQKGAYQGVGLPQFMKAMRGDLNELDKQKMAVIDKVIQEISSGNFEDNTNGSVFYSHNVRGNKYFNPKLPMGAIYYRPGKLGGFAESYVDTSSFLP